MHITVSQLEDLIYEELNKTLTLTEADFGARDPRYRGKPLARGFRNLGEFPEGKQMQKKLVVKFFSSEGYSPPKDDAEDIIQGFVDYYSYKQTRYAQMAVGIAYAKRWRRDQFYNGVFQQEIIYSTTQNEENYNGLLAAMANLNAEIKVTYKNKIQTIQAGLLKQAHATPAGRSGWDSACIIVQHDLIKVAYQNLEKWQKKHNELLEKLLCLDEPGGKGNDAIGCISIKNPMSKKNNKLIQQNLMNYTQKLPIIAEKVSYYMKAIDFYIKNAAKGAVEIMKSRDASPKTKQAGWDYLKVLSDIFGYALPLYDAVNNPNFSKTERVFWATFDITILLLGVAFAAEGLALLGLVLAALEFWFAGMFLFWVMANLVLWLFKHTMTAIKKAIKIYKGVASQGIDGTLSGIPQRCLPKYSSPAPDFGGGDLL